MKEIKLYVNDCLSSIDTLLDDRKIRGIEFKLGINDCDNAREIENYFYELEEKKCFLSPKYEKFVNHKEYWLFYFYDRHGLNNVYHLLISKGDCDITK